MILPEGYTEAEILKIIESIVNQLASSFRFGYHDMDDLKQEGTVYALEALTSGKFNINWNPKDKESSKSNKLYRFLFTHVRNRYINFKRNKFSRLEPPCNSCPFYDPKCEKSTNKCSVFEEKMDCDKWANWTKRQTAKQNLSSPLDIHSINPDGEKNTEYMIDMDDSVFKSELMQEINRELPAQYRADYNRLLQGSKLPKARSDKLIQILKEITYKFEDKNA